MLVPDHELMPEIRRQAKGILAALRGCEEAPRPELLRHGYADDLARWGQGMAGTPLLPFLAFLALAVSNGGLEEFERDLLLEAALAGGLGPDGDRRPSFWWLYEGLLLAKDGHVRDMAAEWASGNHRSEESPYERRASHARIGCGFGVPAIDRRIAKGLHRGMVDEDGMSFLAGVLGWDLEDALSLDRHLWDSWRGRHGLGHRMYALIEERSRDARKALKRAARGKRHDGLGWPDGDWESLAGVAAGQRGTVAMMMAPYLIHQEDLLGLTFSDADLGPEKEASIGRFTEALSFRPGAAESVGSLSRNQYRLRGALVPVGEGRYWLLLPDRLMERTLRSLDLCVAEAAEALRAAGDAKGSKRVAEGYARRRAVALEAIAADALESTLHPDACVRGYEHERLDGETDAVLVAGRHVVIMEAKSRRPSATTRGATHSSGKKDFEDVAEAVGQCLRAERYLREEGQLRLSDGGHVRIPPDAMFLGIAVTLSEVAGFAESNGELAETLGLPEGSRVPWVISLPELMAIGDLSWGAVALLRYLEWRTAGSTSVFRFCDEVAGFLFSIMAGTPESDEVSGGYDIVQLGLSDEDSRRIGYGYAEDPTGRLLREHYYGYVAALGWEEARKLRLLAFLRPPGYLERSLALATELYRGAPQGLFLMPQPEDIVADLKEARRLTVQAELAPDDGGTPGGT